MSSLGSGICLLHGAYAGWACPACSTATPALHNTTRVVPVGEPVGCVMERDARRKAFWVVDDFEEELASYCGSRYAVAVDSCTNALFLALLLERLRHSRDDRPSAVWLPKRTYVGVAQAALNAGWRIVWSDEAWQGSYELAPTRVVDSARDLRRGVYVPSTLTCLSFHAAKQLPLGRGGAVLTNLESDYRWLRAARMDGRREGDNYAGVQTPGFHCYMPPPTAAQGLWMLTSLPDQPADQGHSVDRYPDLSQLGIG